MEIKKIMNFQEFYKNLDFDPANISIKNSMKEGWDGCKNEVLNIIHTIRKNNDNPINDLEDIDVEVKKL